MALIDFVKTKHNQHLRTILMSHPIPSRIIRRLLRSISRPLGVVCAVLLLFACERMASAVPVTIIIRIPLILEADVTGDGRDDRIEITQNNEFLVWGVSWLQHDAVDTTLWSDQIAFVDLNGDGKKDLVVQGLDNRFWVSLSTGTGFTPPVNWVSHGGGYILGQAQYVDVNGDGRADLIFQGNDNHFWVSLSTGKSFLASTVWAIHGGGFRQGQARYADVNGDRKADLVFQGNDNHFWVSLSTGTGFRTPEVWAIHGGTFTENIISYGDWYSQAQYGDANGDGKADLIFRSADGIYWVSLSTGTTFAAPGNWYQERESRWRDTRSQYYLVRDENQDGLADLYFWWWSVEDNGDIAWSIRSSFTMVRGNGATFVNQSVPTTMTAGMVYPVSVTMRNSGTTTWKWESAIRLGSQNGPSNMTWGLQSVDIAPGDVIAPGQSKTFTFTVKAPAVAGAYNFQWQTITYGGVWFGTPSTNVIVNVVAVTAPSIATQPASKSVTAGQTATFSVGALGTAPLAYQWQKNNLDISGATGAAYTTPATTLADSGSTFRVRISNSVSSVTSASATLTVTNITQLLPPTITAPANGAALSGTSATISWNAVSGAAGYLIRCKDLTGTTPFDARNTWNGGPFLYIDKYASSSITVSLVVGHAYSFWIHSVKSNFSYADTTTWSSSSEVRFSMSTSTASTFKASADFSGTQGFRGWSYLDSTGAPLVYDSASSQWKGVEAYLWIWASGFHPGTGRDVVRRWTAPQAGAILITGNVRDLAAGGGDGVVAIIRQNGVELWRTTIVNGNSAGVNFSLAKSVAINDRIDFVVNRNGNYNYDSTTFDPTVVLTPAMPTGTG
jgi:hypothetical protein